MRLPLAIGRLMRANVCLSVYYLYMRTRIYGYVYTRTYTLYTCILYSLYAYRCGRAYTSTPTWNQIECTLCYCDRLMKEMNVVVGSFWSRCPGQGMNEGSHIQVLCGICALVW